jgi:hypothetical protein
MRSTARRHKKAAFSRSSGFSNARSSSDDAFPTSKPAISPKQFTSSSIRRIVDSE